jgi:hypothetical protein
MNSYTNGVTTWYCYRLVIIIVVFVVFVVFVFIVRRYGYLIIIIISITCYYCLLIVCLFILFVYFHVLRRLYCCRCVVCCAVVFLRWRWRNSFFKYPFSNLDSVCLFCIGLLLLQPLSIYLIMSEWTIIYFYIAFILSLITMIVSKSL